MLIELGIFIAIVGLIVYYVEKWYWNDGKATLYDIDNMDGFAFEQYCAGLLKSRGFMSVTITKASGDQGVDIIARKKGRKYAVQCKRYNGTVSNKAIQEVVAGKAFYGCDEAMVITNSRFSKSAIQLGLKNNVILWDRSYLS